MKEFITAAKSAMDIEEQFPGARPLTFKLNGIPVTVSPPSNSGPIGFLLANTSKYSDNGDQAYAVMNFLLGLMSDQDGKFVADSLSRGQLDFETLSDVFNWLLEEWSARPTTPPRGSSSRRRAPGPVLTGGALSEA